MLPVTILVASHSRTTSPRLNDNAVNHLPSPDPDAWMDTVQDVYPKIVPSHYALVNGIEPYER